jgi:hypothetical protein
MPLRFDKSTISNRAWSDVDKTALANRLERALRAGKATSANVGEVYAGVGSNAVRKAGANTRLLRAELWGPHHEIIGDRIVLNVNGLVAARGAISGARLRGGSELRLPTGVSATNVRRHLNRHLAQVNAWRRSNDQAPLEAV